MQWGKAFPVTLIPDNDRITPMQCGKELDFTWISCYSGIVFTKNSKILIATKP